MLGIFSQRDLGLWVFLCPTNDSLFCLYFCLYFVSLFPATTPRAITSLPYHHGLSRLCIHPGYHTRAITLHQTRTSGYHTRHSSSYFVVLSFAGFYATCTSPPTLPPDATRYNLLNSMDSTYALENVYRDTVLPRASATPRLGCLSLCAGLKICFRWIESNSSVLLLFIRTRHILPTP